MEFLVYTSKNDDFCFDLTQLGYSIEESVPVHDIWEGRDLGTVKGTLQTKVASHGVKLFRLGNNKSHEDAVTAPKGDANDKDNFGSERIYNLKGQEIVTPSNNEVYIRNGRKFVRKNRK